MDSQYVCCDGKNNQSSGHPKIYLKLNKKEIIVCPYCSREFGGTKEPHKNECD